MVIQFIFRRLLLEMCLHCKSSCDPTVLFIQSYFQNGSLSFVFYLSYHFLFCLASLPRIVLPHCGVHRLYFVLFAKILLVDRGPEGDDS